LKEQLPILKAKKLNYKSNFECANVSETPKTDVETMKIIVVKRKESYFWGIQNAGKFTFG
jgi:hypothetical protein